MVLKVHLLLIISLSVVGSVLAQSSVSPELIARFNSMSPEEQRALAQQWRFDPRFEGHHSARLAKRIDRNKALG